MSLGRQLRIAYVSDQVLPRTATDTEQSLNMVSALGTAGAVVDLVVPARGQGGHPSAAQLAAHYRVRESFGVTLAGRSVGGVRFLEKAVAALAGVRTAAALEPDFIYTRNLPVAVGALKQCHLPVVYETYRPWPRQRVWLRWLFTRIARAGHRLRLVLHSNLAANSYREVGFPDDRILVAHNGWNPEHMQPVLDKATARQRLGLPADAFLVVYAGSVAPRKGIGLLLDLADDFPQVTFLIVGSRGTGPVERRARRQPNVSMTPWLGYGDVAPYLYGADVLAIPPTLAPLRTVGDTVLPIKTFSYMAAGRAILAPDGPDLREVLQNGRSAVLVTPDDASAARRGLARLRSDRALCARLGTAAREDAEKRTWNGRAHEILKFLARA